MALDAAITYLAELGGAFDKLSYFFAELRFDGFGEDGGVLECVVEESRGDGCGIDVDVCEIVSDVCNMIKVWFTRVAFLSLMRFLCKGVRFFDERRVRLCRRFQERE